MPHHYAIIFGRTPALSRLELEAVAPRFELKVGKMLDPEIALVTAEEPLDLDKLQAVLGGTVRIAELLVEATRETLVKVAADLVLAHAAPEGKLTVGVNAWSKAEVVGKVAKPLKLALTQAGRSIRLVTPPSPRRHLSAPQLIHNKLVGGAAAQAGRAIDVVMIETGGSWWLGITRTVQDIAHYTRRDFGIPKPDPVSGMLPPKLAQTLVNLGVQGKKRAIYDPFCGNGRILLEATLLGFEVYGSDLREQQVEASKENLNWLSQEYGLDYVTPDRVWQADATAGPGRAIGTPFVIVTEPYLGKPLRAKLGLGEHTSWLNDLVPLYEAFFTYWAQSPEQPDQMVVIFPRTTAVDGREVSVFEAIVDRLGQVGYSAEVLFCYDRPDSIVRRDIVQIRSAR